MAARLHRLGNIYSRMDGLIRKGLIKEADRPIWFDVYKNFPPKYDPTFKRRAPEIKVRDILYMEDTLRAKIHKALQNQVGVVNLNSEKEMYCERLLNTCQKYISEGVSEEEAIQKLKDSIEIFKN